MWVQKVSWTYVTSWVCALAPRVLGRFVAAVETADVLSHFLAVRRRQAALHAPVAPFGVFPEDPSAVGHT